MIRLAKISEINEIMLLTKACTAHMVQKGIYQWNERYPSRQAFEKDIQRDELFVLEHDPEIIGTMVITTLMDKEYIPIQWLTPNGKNVYIHRLSVLPDHQGKGYAQKLMDFAEDYAREHDFVSVRLDTFSQNKRNQKFYETRGYHRLGDIQFPKQSKHPFHCYEMVF